MCSFRPLKKFCFTKNKTIPSTMALRKLTFLFLFATIFASAGVKNATTLCIEDNNGTVLKYALQERPQIIFLGNYAVVRSSEIKILQLRNLVKAYFLNENEEPDTVNSATKAEGKISVQAGAISLADFKPATKVLVYTTSGTLVRLGEADATGSLILPIGDLPEGIYVVKAGKTVFKMMR